jgi:hypothetical protein
VVMVGSPESDLSSELTKDELWFIFSCWTLKKGVESEAFF